MILHPRMKVRKMLATYEVQAITIKSSRDGLVEQEEGQSIRRRIHSLDKYMVTRAGKSSSPDVFQKTS